MNLTQKKKTSFRMPYRYDLIIHLCTLILAVFGLFMVASATMGLASGNVMTLMKTIMKQLAFTVLGYLGMVTMARWFTFERMKKNITPIVSLTLVLLLLALCWEVGGARAWIKIPFPGQEITIQPSEFSKVVIIMVMATYLGDIRNLKLTAKDLMRNPLLIVGASASSSQSCSRTSVRRSSWRGRVHLFSDPLPSLVSTAAEDAGDVADHRGCADRMDPVANGRTPDRSAAV